MVGVFGTYVPITISILSFLISAYSFYISITYRKTDIPFDTVSKLYDRYFDIYRVKLQYPYLSHLFATVDKYDGIKRLVESSLITLSASEIVEFRLRERAVVDSLLTFYEQVVFQWTQASVTERHFTKDIIDFMEGRLLKNPRIIWWWGAEEVGLADSYEELTHSRWNKYVLAGVDQTKPDWKDAYGPRMPVPGNF